MEDIVGRYTVNCRTLNEPYSFFGVDLGADRQLAPTCYSLKNRNSESHVLVNWHFEASNDRVNWVLLDRRIYLSDSPQFNKEVSAEQRLLCQKGATSTWGVDPNIYKTPDSNQNSFVDDSFEAPNPYQHGFRYFRIV